MMQILKVSGGQKNKKTKGETKVRLYQQFEIKLSISNKLIS